MNERELDLTIAVLEVLTAMGGTLAQMRHIERAVRLKSEPKATPSEVEERVRWCESRRLITSVRADVGVLYGICPTGKAWLQENG